MTQRLLLVTLLSLAPSGREARAAPRGAGSASARSADAAAPLGKRAREHLTRGLRAFAAKDYRLAIAEFRAGYAAEAHRDFLFAWAQAERLRGDCASAISLYEQFLTQRPPAMEHEAAIRALARCEESVPRLAAAAVPGPDPEADLLASRPKPRPPLVPRAQDRDDESFRHDTLGSVLLAAGVVGLGLGLGFTLAGNSEETDAAEARTYGDFVAHSARADSRRTLGIVGLAGGSGLVVGGILRFIAARRPVESRLCALGDTGRFLVSVRTPF